MAVSSSLLFLLLLLQQATSELVYEYGYTVTTILDGNKLPIPVNPFSLLPAQDGLLLLDSSNSRFYTLSLPISQESVINRFSGDGVGFSDGVPTAAMFNRPRSFAVDSKGNVYVADKNNHAIRKISSTFGVTTIAGGYSQKPGHFDGPGQNASFSDDFDVAYIPKLCSLLITDHGSRLVRQINLKTEDCAHKSPRFEMGMASVSGIGVLCLLLGLVAGFTVRPVLVSNTANLHAPLCQQDMESLLNQSEDSNTDTLLRHQKRSC